MPSACPGHRWVVRAAEKPGYEPGAPSSLNLRVSAGLFGPWTSLLLLVWSLPHGVVAPCQEPKIPRSYTRIFRLDGTLGGVARSPLAKERYQPLGHFSIGVSDRVRTGIDQIHGLALCIKLRSPLTFGTWRRLEGSNLHALTGITGFKPDWQANLASLRGGTGGGGRSRTYKARQGTRFTAGRSRH